MKRPIIGVTPHYDAANNRICIACNYFEAIINSGGIPMLLPLNTEKETLTYAANVCDGFLFSGGPDIDPFRFGEETLKGCGEVLKQRDEMEELIFHQAMDDLKPILGICRGIQVLNVFLGGTLYQDIPLHFPTELCHFQKSNKTVLSHSVIIEKNTLLYDILNKDTILVNSFHHQGIKDVAPTLKTAGWSKDGLVEGVYLPNHPFFLGIQWHPEHLYQVSEDASKLFKAFIQACI